MKKYKMKASNSILQANWYKVKLSHTGNTTANSTITQAMFKRECEMYDNGLLPIEHDRYLGETNE